MARDPRVPRLLEELLETGATPEEVCRDCPELLPEVREGWQRLSAVESRVGELFPPAGSAAGVDPLRALELPRIPGYEVEAVLGHGGMGVVYRARHLRLNRTVALKMLRAGPFARPQERDRFLREAEAVAGLRHPNIVQVYDGGEFDGRPFFTMEYVEGGTLSRKLAGTPLPAREAAALVATLASAVRVAHEGGIVHRDLKPSNVLLSDPRGADGLPGGGQPAWVPKVADFGLARSLDGAGITRSGVVVGTPSYMAPEQVRGEAVGPAADVYALGAILYECLTGRPPFRADTDLETVLQAATRDPVPPSRLNARVPHDLETICLKCLERDPRRRYHSAAALADDLLRFGRGETIAARPLGRLRRLARWAQRYPGRAALLAATVLAALAATGAGGWLIGQRSRTAQAVEGDLREVVRLQQQSALPEARSILERTQLRLGDDGPAWLHSRMDRVWHDQRLLERLEAIRTARSTFVAGRENHLAGVRFNNSQADRDYQEAFREASLGEPPDDPDGVARRIKDSLLLSSLVCALNDWAVCSPDPARRDWALRVARAADPDPWRDRVRDPATWSDAGALAELARTAPVAEQPPPLLLALGERLQLAGGDGTPLLQSAQGQYPNDFWANFTLANILYGLAQLHKGDAAHAAAYYQKALALRPGAAVHNNLGLALYTRYWLDDNATGWGGPGAITVYQRALRLDPECAPAHNNLGLALKGAGLLGSARNAYREALRINPRLAPAHYNLGHLKAASGQFNQAIDHYRQATRIEPDYALAHYGLGLALVAKGRRDEVDDDYPEGVEALAKFRWSALREAVDYHWQAHEFKPEWVAVRNGLQISPQDSARLGEAIDHYRQAIRIDPRRGQPHGALAQALLAKRQFGEAEAAARRCLELLPEKESKLRANAELLQNRCSRLLALERRLPGIVRGTDKPFAGECLDAAELCLAGKHYASAARLYAAAPAAAPEWTKDLRAGHFFNAARAAALAGCGHGDDVAGLGEVELKGLRGQACQWLRRDLAAWAGKLDSGELGDRVQARKALSTWRHEPALAGLRDRGELEKLSPGEREECRSLWRDLDALLERAGAVK